MSSFFPLLYLQTYSTAGLGLYIAYFGKSGVSGPRNGVCALCHGIKKGLHENVRQSMPEIKIEHPNSQVTKQAGIVA